MATFTNSRLPQIVDRALTVVGVTSAATEVQAGGAVVEILFKDRVLELVCAHDGEVTWLSYLLDGDGRISDQAGTVPVIPFQDACVQQVVRDWIAGLCP